MATQESINLRRALAQKRINETRERIKKLDIKEFRELESMRPMRPNLPHGLKYSEMEMVELSADWFDSIETYLNKKSSLVGKIKSIFGK